MPEVAGPPRAVTYSEVYLNQRIPPEKQGKRTREELSSLVLSIDSPSEEYEGKDPQDMVEAFDEAKARTADLLMQWFKAVGQAVLDSGNWWTAKTLSILP